MAELLLRDGDYVPDGQGGLRRAEGTDGLLQRVLFQLSARRGSFPFLPELGSRLYRLTQEKPGARAALARQYAAEALAEQLRAVVVAVIGRKIILFRRPLNPKNRRIELPGRGTV